MAKLELICTYIDIRSLAHSIKKVKRCTFPPSGPNSPLKWVEENVLAIDPDGSHRSKILLGLNFYGLEYTAEGGGGHIMGRDGIHQV